MSQRQVSTNYLFELIGRQHVELGILRHEHAALLEQTKKMAKEEDSILIPDPAARGPE